MEFYVAVFRARTQTLIFANLLKSYGVKCNVINTPRVINVSCGISVKLSKFDFVRAQEIINRRKFDSFAGFYLVKEINGQIILI